MENIKDMAISITFLLICSVGLLFFILEYPALNGQQSVLADNPEFNRTAQNLSILLGGLQDKVNTDINITTSDNPQASAQGLYLVSTTATSRNFMSRTFESFKLLTTLLGNAFGLSGTTFFFITGSLIALFGLILLYNVVKAIRWGS